MKRTKRHRHGSRNRSQSRRSRKPGFTFYIPAPPSPPLPPGQPATQEGSKRARAVALDYCLVQRWTYLGAFKRKRTFSSSPSRQGGREGREGKEPRSRGGGRPNRGGREACSAGRGGKKFHRHSLLYPSGSEKVRSGGDAASCRATNVRSFLPPWRSALNFGFLHRDHLDKSSLFEHRMDSRLCLPLYLEMKEVEALPVSSRGNVKASSHFRTAASE